MNPVQGWVSSEVGRFLVQVKLPANFAVSQRVYGSMQLNATVQPNGSYSVTLNLPAVNNEATDYQVEAVFCSDSTFNFTSHGYSAE